MRLKNSMKNTYQKRVNRAARVRTKLRRFNVRPRLSVFRSLKHISAQIIDDAKGTTLVSVSDRQLTVSGKKTKTEIAALVGEALGAKAKAKKITNVTFDRGRYAYFGRVKALAEAARQKGLEF